MKHPQTAKSGVPHAVAIMACALVLGAFLLFPENGSAEVHSRLQENATHDLDGMIEKHLIRVLTVFAPSVFYIDNGRFDGLEHDLLMQYQQSLNKGRAPGKRIILEFIPTRPDDLIPFLNRGRGDIAAALLTVTPGRDEFAAFTNPYLTNVSEVLVTHRSIAGINRLEDLAGKAVLVRPASSYYQSLVRLNEKFTAQGLPPVDIIPASEVLSTEKILEMVNADIISMTIADDFQARRWSKALPDIRVREDIAVAQGGSIAWMVRKDNPQLLASLNGFAQTVRKGTLLGNILFKRYYTAGAELEHPLDEPYEIENFSRFSPLFKKYAARYNMDWLMVAALAYQESKFNPEAVSRTGAYGLMQILPSVAKDKSIGVPDIHDPESNIYAGVKYLDLIRKTYFNDPGLDAFNKMCFTFAAYNAGPSRIGRVRQLAKQMGLDADVWFYQTEFAALRLAGVETVDYVSKIIMYYQALSLADKLARSRAEAIGVLTRRP
ncbi:MAG: transglycosylase SLT domain-containing protein [Desulfovibrionaceae bacterium]